jgi:hypothetical protein
MIEFITAFTLGVAAGATLIWFCKIRIQAIVIDANVLATRLHAKADAVATLVRKA